MAKICDRCGSRSVNRSYYEKVAGQEVDLCIPCDEGFLEYLRRGTSEEAPPLKDEKKPKPRKGS